MSTAIMELLSLTILLVFFFSPLHTHLSMAEDTISPGTSLSGNHTIVSKGGNFELGFFTPGNSHHYYIGIWYKKVSEPTFIWVANREKPVTNTSSSELKMSEDGHLVLLNHLKIPVWSSNSTLSRPSSNVAVLLDTGNLVLSTRSSNTSAVIWQSFDHPTNTWMPGSWLGLNRVTGENQYISSWKNLEDPAPGSFSFTIDEGGSSEYFLEWNRHVRYWRTGIWNGRFFSLVPEMSANPSFKFTFIENEQEKYGMYPSSSIIGRATVDLTGQIKWWIWVDSSQKWLLIWTAPSSHCAVYSPCGAFGVCDEKSSLPCRCLYGFEPASTRDWELNDWNSGCARRTNLQCGNSTSINGTKDGFLMMSNMQLPVNSQPLAVASAKDCELACLNSCNCTAYAYDGGGCSVWDGDLRNLQQLSEGDNKARTLFLRLAASDLPNSSSKKKTVIVVSVGVAVGVVILVCIVLGISWWRRKRRLRQVAKVTEGSLVRFRFSDLQHVTKNFSEELGRGGFGSVFKGALADSTAVAVKKLEGHGQGEKQFRTEVSTLGTIQHVNLVRLRGFCSEGDERLLVYDYMPNGSLDCYLFRNNSSNVISWKMRFQIVLGIARGLAYLHEKCRDQIIHCDIKPENILLDAEFCPKVADFGMAKLFGRNFSGVLTTMRGTIGYLAPEWISGLAITTKADVYSFGMMLFEVISGRRNMEQSADGKFVFFPVRATRKVHEGEILSISDEKFAGDVDMGELTRACRVACWCIQDSEVNRPSMDLVVKILEGALEVNVPPIPLSLQRLTGDQDSASSSTKFFSAKCSHGSE